MKVLINRLNKYFLTNKTLENFASILKKTINEIKINPRVGSTLPFLPLDFKNDLIFGTYSKKRLFFNKKYEIIFITWGKNCESPIHYHPNNGCLLIVLYGDLIEERYNDKDEILDSPPNFLKSGNISYIHDDIGKHKMINKNNHNVYTLHIYSPPFFYDKETRGGVT